MAARLTARAWETLTEARRGPLRRVHDVEHGQPRWPAHPSTLLSLVRRGLLACGERKSKKGHRLQEWTITDDGLEALNPPAVVRREPVRSLSAKGAARTRMMQFGVWVDVAAPEPEPVDPADVDAAWFGGALERHSEQRDRKERARQLGRHRRAA